MPIQSPRDLLVYDLSYMLSAEQMMLNILPQMEQRCSNSQIRQAFSDHITTTQRQVTRVQECFRALGAQPMNVTCHTIDCMQRDFQQFMQHNPSQECIDLFCLGASAQAEYFEIGSYRGMVEKCRAMGESQCASLLEDTLHEEESMCQHVEQLGSQIGSQVIQRMTP